MRLCWKRKDPGEFGKIIGDEEREDFRGIKGKGGEIEIHSVKHPRRRKNLSQTGRRLEVGEENPTPQKKSGRVFCWK